MSSDLTIPGASPFDSIKQADEGGREFWPARDLMPLLGYDSWRRFEDAIERAEAACATFMQRIGWIYRDQRGKPVPYQTQIDNGRLIAKAQFHYHPETGEVVADAPQVRVTAKGLDALRTKYLAGGAA